MGKVTSFWKYFRSFGTSTGILWKVLENELPTALFSCRSKEVSIRKVCKNNLTKLQMWLFWDLTNYCPKRSNPYFTINRGTPHLVIKREKQNMKVCLPHMLIFKEYSMVVHISSVCHLKGTLLSNKSIQWNPIRPQGAMVPLGKNHKALLGLKC